MYVAVPAPRPLVLPTGRAITSLVTLLALLATTLAGLAQPDRLPSRVTPAVPSRPALEQLPLAFEPNAGQTDPAVHFQVRGLGGMVYFTDREVVMALPQDGTAQSDMLSVLRLAFDGADTPEVAGAEPLPGTVSYFIGDDSTRWRNDIATYAAVVYQGLYPGVDLRYDGTGGRLKGTFTVAPGVDPASIRWRYTGAEAVAVDAATGDLRITPTGVGHGAALTEAAPVAWQEIRGRRVPVDARFAVAADNSASFVLGAYDRAEPLIIDPTLSFSTALGGSLHDEATGVAVDPAGNTYVTGYTSSTDFPTGNAVQTTNSGMDDAFVTKINPEGTAQVYSTYIGGTNREGYYGGGAIATDQAGNAYITGSTTSPDFPTVGAIQDRIVHDSDFYVVKLSPSGNGLVYSTYLGGSERDVGEGIAVDYDGNAYVTGGAGRNFPLANPIFTYNGTDAVVAKLNAGGSKLVYSTFLGGSSIDAGQAIAVDWEGSAYVGGYSNIINSSGFPLVNALQPTPGGGNKDGFVAKLNPAGDALVYSTYLGGVGDDWVEGVAVDAAGNVAVMGNTSSTNFPLRNAYQDGHGGRQDAFVTKLNAAGSDFVFSTYLGGNYDENSVSNREGGIAVDPEGGIYVTGWTGSTNFRAIDPLHPRRLGSDVFVTKFQANGAVVYSTPLGGNSSEYGMGVAVDDAGTAHVAGTTMSPDFPTVAPLQTTLANNSNHDAFVSRIAHGPGRTVLFDPGAVVFGTEPIDTPSLPETVYIANVGTAALPLGAVTLTGPNAGDFTLTKNNCANRSLAADIECRIEVRFTPRGSGLRTARIVVASSVWAGPRSIFLRGTGRPNVVVDPSELDFGFQIKDTTTPALRVTLTNLASSSGQTISTPSITGLHRDDFALATTCGSSIPGGGSCTVDVTFTPKALDGRYARLSVLPQGADRPLSVPLSGFGGTTPSITVSQDRATPIGDVPLVTRDKEVQISGRNFNITSTNNKVRVYIGTRDIITLDVQSDRTIFGKFTIPVDLEGELTVEAEHLGLPSDVPVTARIRTPMEDLPVILIPGVSGTKLIAEQQFTYVAPGNPELAIPVPDPFQLLPFGYTYHAEEPVWIYARQVVNAAIGHHRDIDALMLDHYGSSPDPDVLGDTSRRIVPGEILWNVDLGVTKQDAYGDLRDHILENLRYTAADKAGATTGSRRVYYFGYDWRKDVYGTAPDLNEMVKRAMRETGKTKVNIIAHSMGGWVTRNYLLQYGASDVDQVITLGTPFLGAPMALKVLEHGDDWGMIGHPFNNYGGPLGDIGIGLHPKQMKRLARNFPSAYELLPSKYWFQGRPFSFTADPAYITRSVNNSGTMEYELLGAGETSRFLRQRHNYDLVRTAERFHAQGIGDLSLLTNQYIHHRIVGSEVASHGRIEYSPRKVCATVFVLVCTDIPEFAFPKMNLLGDGTVPLHSALGAYAPPDGRAYQLPGVKHGPLTKDQGSLTLVGEMLSGERTNSVVGPGSAGVAGLASMAAADMPAAESFVASGVEISLLGAGNLTITDDQGRISGHVPGSRFATVQQIPGVTFIRSEGSQVAMLPATGTFRVTISGTPAGGAAQLRMSEVAGGTNKESLVFQTIPLTAETVATASASGAGVPASSTMTFKYDASSTEQTVGTLPPVIGAESKDMTPPLSKIAMSEDGVITLTAQDEAGGSGVASILYSTDGVTFKTYTAPFRAPTGTRLITAVAVDRVGNAESPGAQVTLTVVEPTATPVPATPTPTATSQPTVPTPTPTATSQPTVPTPTPNGRGTVYLPLVQR